MDRLLGEHGFKADNPTSTGVHSLQATKYSNQSSGVLSSISHSNALAVIPAGLVVAIGEEVEVLLLDALL